MRHYAIITHEYMEDSFIRKDEDGFTMLFITEEEAQEVIDKNNWEEDSAVIELNIKS
jgi:hypothetical protein